MRSAGQASAFSTPTVRTLASVRADAPPNPRGALGDRRRETRQCPVRVLFGGTAAVLCAQSMTQQQASEIPAWLVRIGLSGCTLQIGRHVLPFMLAAVRA